MIAYILYEYQTKAIENCLVALISCRSSQLSRREISNMYAFLRTFSKISNYYKREIPALGLPGIGAFTCEGVSSKISYVEVHRG